MRRERDTDLRDRGDGESSSMSVSTLEVLELNLCPAFTPFDKKPWGLEVHRLFIFVKSYW